jgi:hypothetical protein
MKKVFAALLIIVFCAGIVFAQARPVTGGDWLKVDKKTRIQLVKNFVRDVKKEGVTVFKDAVFYCQKLDKLYATKPSLLTEPVWKVLKTAIIMEYDWNEKGVDQDTLARQWLGEKLYDKNKERHGKI